MSAHNHHHREARRVSVAPMPYSPCEYKPQTGELSADDYAKAFRSGALKALVDSHAEQPSEVDETERSIIGKLSAPEMILMGPGVLPYLTRMQRAELAQYMWRLKRERSFPDPSQSRLCRRNTGPHRRREEPMEQTITVELERQETILEESDELADWSVKITASLNSDGTWGYTSSTHIGRVTLDDHQTEGFPSKAAAATYAADQISRRLKTLPAKNGKAGLRLKSISRALDRMDKSLAGQVGSAQEENKAAVSAIEPTPTLEWFEEAADEYMAESCVRIPRGDGEADMSGWWYVSRNDVGLWVIEAEPGLTKGNIGPHPTLKAAQAWCEARDAELQEKLNHKAAANASAISGTAAEKDRVTTINTEANDPGEQGVMFPELGSTPEEKALVKLCKQLLKIRLDRKEALNESKEKEDKCQEDCVKKMHECDLTSFTHDGIKVELVKNSEKVKIKPDPKDDDEDGE